jgi:hypothetical protein
MTDWQALWDETELLYDKFREAKPPEEDDPETHRMIEQCLGHLGMVESELERTGEVITHTVHEEDDDPDPDGPITCKVCGEPVIWSKKFRFVHRIPPVGNPHAAVAIREEEPDDSARLTFEETGVSPSFSDKG